MFWKARSRALTHNEMCFAPLFLLLHRHKAPIYIGNLLISLAIIFYAQFTLITNLNWDLTWRRRLASLASLRLNFKFLGNFAHFQQQNSNSSIAMFSPQSRWIHLGCILSCKPWRLTNNINLIVQQISTWTCGFHLVFMKYHYINFSLFQLQAPLFLMASILISFRKILQLYQYSLSLRGWSGGPLALQGLVWWTRYIKMNAFAQSIPQVGAAVGDMILMFAVGLKLGSVQHRLYIL